MTSPIIDFIAARLDEAQNDAETRNTAAFIHETGCYYYNNQYDPAYCDCDGPEHALREVQAKRAILERESAVTLPEWKPDCGGDWVLSGTGFFANYWPDNTVSASITDGFDGPTLADSGIVSKDSRAACQAFAESWVREHLPQRSPVLRALAAIYSDHPDYRKEWAA